LTNYFDLADAAAAAAAAPLRHFATSRYSIAVLVVEAIGVSALIPYALANLRPTLPIMEPEKDAPKTWKEFGADK
jgi:hypothetical protein